MICKFDTLIFPEKQNQKTLMYTRSLIAVSNFLILAELSSVPENKILKTITTTK